jgi:hypothetical protein
MDGLVIKKLWHCAATISCEKLGFAPSYRQSALQIIRAISIKKVLALH